MSKAFKRASNTEVMLRMIEANGGMRFTEIQRLLWKLANPGDDVSKMGRGCYCTSLLGGPFYHAGVLRFFCAKGSDGLWRRNPNVTIEPPWKRNIVQAYMPADDWMSLKDWLVENG